MHGPTCIVWANLTPFALKPDDPNDEHVGWQYKAPGDAPVSSPGGHGSFPCDDALRPDTVTHCATIREVYELANAPPGTTYSTPVLWDSKEKTIVNNESTEILRMFNDAFGDLAANPAVDIFPDTMGVDKQLADLNDTVVYPSVNNGVYRCSHGRQSHFRAALLITPWIITIST